jgi:site-specific DNA-methyltransferase (adenine-specific)
MEVDKIYNEDCYKGIKNIPDKSIDLIVTDPPYLIESTKGGKNSKLAKSITNMNNQLEDNNLTCSIDEKILDEFMRVMKVPNIYIWCNHKQIPLYLNYFVLKNHCNFDIIIWHKTNAIPLFCNKYMTDKEYCLYFRKGGYCNPTSYENAKTVYELPINKADKDLYEHPTIKPLEIIKNIITNSSKQNDVVLDCFMGSGTTAVACKQLNRHYIGFELNPEYYQIAIDRVNGLTVADRKKKELGQISLFDIE